MLYSLLILPLLLAATPAPPFSTPDANRARCPKPVTTSEKATFQRLGDLPPAEAFNAVWRSSDCTAPAVLARDRLGPVPKPRR